MTTPVLRPADNGVYYAFWSVGRRGLRKSMRSADLAVAERRFAEWLLLGGHRADRSGKTSDLTVAECWTVYAAKRPSEALAFYWKTLEPHFGRLLVAQVDQAQCDAYVERRTAGKLGDVVKPQSCRRALAALFAALRFCAAKPQSLFSSTIIERVKLPADGAPRERWLRLGEMQRLIDAAARLRRGPRLSRGERYLWIALEAPARMQAILDLTWDRVDFDTGTIDFNDPGRAKTKKRRVTVAMSGALRKVLARAHAERIGELVMDDKADVWSTVQDIAREAGFGDPATRKATGIRPHVLRHTAATHMARNKVPLWKIANILGNTLAMTERVYAKWCPDDPAGTVDMISGGKLEAAE